MTNKKSTDSNKFKIKNNCKSLLATKSCKRVFRFQIIIDKNFLMIILVRQFKDNLFFQIKEIVEILKSKYFKFDHNLNIKFAKPTLK